MKLPFLPRDDTTVNLEADSLGLDDLKRLEVVAGVVTVRSPGHDNKSVRCSREMRNYNRKSNSPDLSIVLELLLLHLFPREGASRKVSESLHGVAAEDGS